MVCGGVFVLPRLSIVCRIVEGVNMLFITRLGEQPGGPKQSVEREERRVAHMRVGFSLGVWLKVGHQRLAFSATQ